MPVALNGANMDIPLPGITVDEFASAECADYTSMLQTARHLIELRKLEDKVLHRVHLRDRAQTVSLTPSDRRIIAQDLRIEIEDWYSSGCLLNSTDSDDIRIHIRISWLAGRYYNLLLLLYYPSESNPTASLLSRSELVSLAQKHVQANAVRLRQRQLPLNHVILCRLLPVCMVFLHCLLAQGPGAPPPPVGVHEEASICADVMDAYPSHWTQAHHAAAVVRQLAALLRAPQTTTSSSPSSAGGAQRVGRGVAARRQGAPDGAHAAGARQGQRVQGGRGVGRRSRCRGASRCGRVAAARRPDYNAEEGRRRRWPLGHVRGWTAGRGLACGRRSFFGVLDHGLFMISWGRTAGLQTGVLWLGLLVCV